MLAALLLPTLLTGAAEPPAGAVKLGAPRVRYLENEASATRAPWVDANGGELERNKGKTFFYQVKGEAAALAAAEAFTYAATAFVSADSGGAEAFGRMLTFLKTVPAAELPPVADFGVVDDESNATGELLNLLSRMNLLFKIGKTVDPRFRINVRLGTKEYPLEEARNPSVLAHKIRSQIGDDNRSLRIYGSEVVVGHLLADSRQARVFLLNYSSRPISGLRIRVKGSIAKGHLRAFGIANNQLSDLTRDEQATEFTVPEFGQFAVVDLSRD